MRTLITLFLRWLCGLLFPTNGTHRADPEAVAPEPVAVPVQRRTLPPLDGHEAALTRPYVIAWEQASTEERERILRRNRRMDAAEVAA
ncbi:hypothetical protein [Streptomyces sp. NPDC056821]|uniref:hypothetical protein n=1 Tax=unclassified Streptomyces TaxID=2593676 RepID=UPI0036A59768